MYWNCNVNNRPENALLTVFFWHYMVSTARKFDFDEGGSDYKGHCLPGRSGEAFPVF